MQVDVQHARLEVPTEGTLLGALDLGSNSFHLTIARVVGGDLELLERAKDKVQLAAGLDADGNLDADALARGLASIGRMAERLRAVAPEHVHVVGTSALRQAGNREAFLRPAAQALGAPVEVISGEEEARLVFLGVANMVADDRERLVIDIGGGSTEFAVGTGFEPGSSVSVAAGCVTLTRRFFSGDGAMGPRMDEALARVRRQFGGLRPQLGAWQEVVGTSGSAQSIRDVLEVNGWSDGTITRDGLARIRRELASCRLGVDPGLAGLAPERTDIFPAGVVIMEAAMAELGIEALTWSEGSLQDGVLFQALGVPQQVNIRDRSVERLQVRCGVDLVQARRVVDLAARLHADVAADLGLDDAESVDLLRWGAALHEAGLLVAHSHHERHGAYILQHAALRGFRPGQRQAVALLVRCHRRGLPGMAFAALDAQAAQRLRWLAVLLRLAVMLNRSRVDSRHEGVGLAVDGESLRLHLPIGWRGAHPLGREELAREVELLGSAGVGLEVVEGAREN